MGSSLFSPTHLVILLAVALLLFGAKRLPEIGRSLGVGMREFKDSVTGIQEATRLETHSELPPPQRRPWPRRPKHPRRLLWPPSPSVVAPVVAELPWSQSPSARPSPSPSARCRRCRGSGFRVAWTTARKRRSSSISTSCAQRLFICIGALVVGAVVGFVIHAQLINWLELDAPAEVPRQADRALAGRGVHDDDLGLDLLRGRARPAGASSGRPGRSSSPRSTRAHARLMKWFTALRHPARPRRASPSATSSSCRRRSHFLTGFDSTQLHYIPQAKPFLSFCVNVLLAMALVFELPLFIVSADPARDPDHDQAAQEPADRLLHLHRRRARLPGVDSGHDRSSRRPRSGSSSRARSGSPCCSTAAQTRVKTAALET